MQPSGIVDLSDKARQVGDDIFEGLGSHRADRLYLERFHEAFRLGIVVGIAPSRPMEPIKPLSSSVLRIRAADAIADDPA